MRCPVCRSEDIKVVDTRSHDTCIMRRRICNLCDTAWRTIEMHEKAIRVLPNTPDLPVDTKRITT